MHAARLFLGDTQFARIMRAHADLGFMVFCLCLAAIIFVPRPAQAANSYNIASGATATINEWGGCRKITNSHASGKAIFVPTKTLTEWQTFVNNLPAGVTAASCWTTTSLLMHCNGADNGTTFTNNGSGGALTRNGSTITDTAQKKFGTAGCYFDGAGDWLENTSTTAWDFAADFTVEWWARVATGETTGGFIDLRPSGNSVIFVELYTSGGVGTLRGANNGQLRHL